MSSPSDTPQTQTMRQVLDELRSDLNDLKTRYYQRQIPDVMTFSDLQDLAVDDALAAIQSLVEDLIAKKRDVYITDVLGLEHDLAVRDQLRREILADLPKVMGTNSKGDKQ